MEILLVDDDPTTLLLIGLRLRTLQFDVIEARDGLEAQAILRQRSVALVLCDWNMEGMDGIDLCRWLRADTSRPYTYFILLTGRNDKQSLIDGMDAGADDFLVKPVDPEELKVRIRAGQRLIELQAQLAEKNRALEHFNNELQQRYDSVYRELDGANKIYSTLCRDIDAAAKLQQSLLPSPATIGGIRSDGLFLPAQMLAGDMFGYFELDADHLAFFILDVSGHGVPSALFSFSVAQILTPSGENYSLLKRPSTSPPYFTLTPPAQVAAELNAHFASADDRDIYFTMIYGLIHHPSGNVTFVQAGHPPPVLVRGDGGGARHVGSGGFAIGFFPDLPYDEIQLQMTPGDRLVLYSDGIVECCNAEGEAYGVERLERLLLTHAGRSLEQLIPAVRAELLAWRGVAEFDDDISLLVLERP
ncbi:PP2C family protein-serine/threonine phosphatase [Methylotetracoccus oryzae]|uniref:PP2C family protein-serine/threonine phosphatase n=1 Tax=Methylotetracoccus oryzae TaxID=1919059 RepID=UPI001118BC88|nr:SpoIIE family protein phosphatase [Methylotetracoccus oryzae]